MNHYGEFLPLLGRALGDLDEWRASFGPVEHTAPQDPAAMEKVLGELVARLKENYPFHHPRYAGQMLKPPHPLAWLAYSLTSTINPNNHSADGGRPTSDMEKEAVDWIAQMVGFPSSYMGHLTSGGTLANLEALWVSRELHPGKGIAFSENAHYTHSRMGHVLGMQTYELATDRHGAPDPEQLRGLAGKVGTVVVTLGTTGRGMVEPLHQMLPVARELGMRVHVDAAYGGFFKLIAGTLGIDDAPWRALDQVDSFVIDPHKHGLQPYGSGCILFRDPSVGDYYKHDSPYTYFTAAKFHMGEITLECSRPGAAAAALWATLKYLPLRSHEGLGPVLADCRQAALDLAAAIEAHEGWMLFEQPQLDIVTWSVKPGSAPAASANGSTGTVAATTSALSQANKAWFEAKMTDPASPWFVTIFRVPSAKFLEKHPGIVADTPEVTVLRSVLMKPEHLGGLQGLLD
jgi:glutamate/tyrosine decarboxylase-like PLP-dependent enzyme